MKTELNKRLMNVGANRKPTIKYHEPEYHGPDFSRWFQLAEESRQIIKALNEQNKKFKRMQKGEE